MSERKEEDPRSLREQELDEIASQDGDTTATSSGKKNKKKGKGESKLKVRKYDPIARKHVLFEDRKLSKLKKKYAAAASTEAK